MPTVRIDDPPAMNVLGLFLASSLRRNLVEREKPCALRGLLQVNAEGMIATIRFEDDGVTVTRQDKTADVVLSGPLPALVRALIRPGLRSIWGVKVRGNRLLALKALKFLRP